MGPHGTRSEGLGTVFTKGINVVAEDLRRFLKVYSDLKWGEYSHAKAQRAQRKDIKLGVLASLREY